MQVEERLLLVKRDKIGDLLLTVPMIAHLKAQRPGWRVEVLANDWNAWVLAGHPLVDRLWTYSRVRSGRRLSPAALPAQLALHARLRWRGYGAAIAAGGEASPRANRRVAWIGARRSIGYCDRGDGCGLSDPQPVGQGHEALRMARLLLPLGLWVPETTAQLPAPFFVPPAAALAEADAWLAGQKLAPGGYVVLGLGARKARRQPDARQVLLLADRAWQAGLAVVFIWTPGQADDPGYPGDDATAAPVLAAGHPAIRPFRGSLQPALGLVWRARTSVFPDSGLMHLAAASPGGVLGLFAHRGQSTSPEQWGPLGPGAAWLESAGTVPELADDVLLAGLDARLSMAN